MGYGSAMDLLTLHTHSISRFMHKTTLFDEDMLANVYNNVTLSVFPEQNLRKCTLELYTIKIVVSYSEVVVFYGTCCQVW